MLKVVDAVMGSGKSSAAIQYINTHPRKKYLVITPFLQETERFRAACPKANFKVPLNTEQEYDYKKVEHFKSLVKKGCSVAFTHKLFSMIDSETCKTITDKGYVIFIDEAVSAIDNLIINTVDMQMFESAGFVVKRESGNVSQEFIEYNRSLKEYNGEMYREINNIVSSNRVLMGHRTTGRNTEVYYSTMHPDMFRLSDEIYIMTYMFEGSILCAYLKLNGIEFQYTGVKKTSTGEYLFSDDATQPEYLKNIRSLITVIDHNINSIGDASNALSVSWYDRALEHKDNHDIERLKNHIYNFFRNICKGSKEEERLWTTFSNLEKRLAGNGYKKRFLAFNARSVNEYAGCRYVAYCVNVYMHPDILKFFVANGQTISKDAYALSIMLQFIWRSAIRNGEPITVYVPSSRMRNLLLGWMSRVEQGLPR